VSVRVQIPPVLRGLAGGRRALEAEGATLAAVLANLARNQPALALHLFDENGAVRRHVLCIHDGNVVRSNDFATHALASDDEVIMANALAGG
jgi:sulfur carrier protein ThiS